MLLRHGLIKLPTKYGILAVIGYSSGIKTHLALILGHIRPSDKVLVRIQSSCLFGEAFQTLDCDCRSQLHESLQLIAKEGSGLVIHLAQEGRGVGLARKLDAMYVEQSQGLDTVEAFRALGWKADERTYQAAVHILHDLGVGAVRLLTNNPMKVDALREGGIQVEVIPLHVKATEFSRAYLIAKRDKLGHMLDIP